uniref:Pacifastin domain-containing protein n=1 Tax=Arion vulgaris TaxID=1028688 RepID=A0A0B7AS10_9EUPU
MRNQRFSTYLLSRGDCTNLKDDRCVCGVDGVPSCTAEVIDRKAYPAITISLNPVFPASSSLVIPKVVYYERSFPKYDQHGARITAPEYYSDSSYARDEEESGNTPTNKQHRRRHFLVKRYASSNHRKHSQELYNNNDRWHQIPRYERSSAAHSSLSHNRQNSKENFADSEGRNRGIFRIGRKVNSLGTLHPRDASTTFDGSRLYHDNKKRGISSVPKYNRDDTISEHVVGDSYNNEKKEIRRKIKPESLSEIKDYRERTKVQDRRVLEEVRINDGPVDETRSDTAPSSLLIASDNRCRWGVRWYGGSLRCYCDLDNSITCGDPSFVASRIDGFRLERIVCEEGHVWEDEATCRECECQISGFVLCRRSPSCPLPFLIKQLPMDADTSFDGKDIGEKSQLSIGQTDEFTGRAEQNIDWVKSKTETKPTPDDKDTDSNEGIYVNIDSTDSSNTDKTKVDTLNLSMHKGNESNNSKIDNTNNNTPADIERDVINSNEIVDLNFDKNSDKKMVVEEKTNDIDKSDSKRTSPTIFSECKLKSRWLDGCKRCECDQNGRKYCDDSRCLKPMSVNMEITNASSQNVDKLPSRPVQRPPEGFFLSRFRPVDLNPTFLLTDLCSNITNGQKYWDDCNICICTPHGPKCTAKNCS